MLTHHDPSHDDARLDQVATETREQWVELQGGEEQVELAREGAVLS